MLRSGRSGTTRHATNLPPLALFHHLTALGRLIALWIQHITDAVSRLAPRMRGLNRQLYAGTPLRRSRGSICRLRLPYWKYFPLVGFCFFLLPAARARDRFTRAMSVTHLTSGNPDRNTAQIARLNVVVIELRDLPLRFPKPRALRYADFRS